MMIQGRWLIMTDNLYFEVIVKLDESKDTTQLIKDIDTEQYTLIIGKIDANKPFKRLKEIKAEVIKQIQTEYQTNNIQVKLI